MTKAHTEDTSMLQEKIGLNLNIIDVSFKLTLTFKQLLEIPWKIFSKHWIICSRYLRKLDPDIASVIFRAKLRFTTLK